ncbi:MAG TPA: hypothetical protein VEG60_21505 [Candidatus Binatia bacterium]|nr:hypothetical protein [Candidatus Binatia bacterium]
MATNGRHSEPVMDRLRRSLREDELQQLLTFVQSLAPRQVMRLRKLIRVLIRQQLH